MAFNVGSISAYTNETKEQLIEKAILTGKTLSLVSIIPGIKYKETINSLENTVTVANAVCGWSPAGTVTFNQRVIEVTALEVKDALCPKTLEKYYLGQLMKPGAPKDLELGPIVAESYVKQVQAINEKTFWQGGMGSPVYGKFNGFVKILSTEATRVDVSAMGSPAVGSGPYTAATIIGIVDMMVSNTPEEILDAPGLTLFMSLGNYMLYTAALRTANLFHYNGENGANYETLIPGTNIKAVGIAGLTGTNYMILTYAQNLAIGTDMMNEEEKFDIWYSKDNDEVRVLIEYKYGTQVYFPEFCVTNF